VTKQVSYMHCYIAHAQQQDIALMLKSIMDPPMLITAKELMELIDDLGNDKVFVVTAGFILGVYNL
jgi:hypothetical protein